MFAESNDHGTDEKRPRIEELVQSRCGRDRHAVPRKCGRRQERQRTHLWRDGQSAIGQKLIIVPILSE